MRRTVGEITANELRSLAEAWGIDVTEAEAEEVRDRVNDRLDGLDDVYSLPIRPPATTGDREWWNPTVDENPHNALVVRCDVLPTSDGPLSGSSVGLKDNIQLAGIPTECGSTVMEGFVPAEDATVVSRLRAAGARITAKTNLDEFAGGGRGLGVDGFISHPMDDDRIAGGSSGGSAAAVSAGLVDVALGTDTGGSVRIPAALCGLVGLKPTYGLIPLTGVVENTYTLDNVGIISESVVDSAACLEAIAGKDDRDVASLAAAGLDEYRIGGYIEASNDPIPLGDLSLLRLEEAFDNCEPEVADAVDGALDAVERGGGTVRDVSLPEFELVGHLKDCISSPELAQFWRDGGAPLRRAGGGASRDLVGFARRARSASVELNRYYRSRILAGARLLTAHDGRHYTRALSARRELRARVDRLLADADAIVCPTVRDVAPLKEHAEDPESGVSGNTRLANLTEHPAMTVPCGAVDGLPVGLHVQGRHFAETTLLRVAAGLEDGV